VAFCRPNRDANSANYRALEILCDKPNYASMKTTLFLLLGLSLLFTSCRNRRGEGPVEQAGRGVDNAVDWVGYGVRRTGEGIQRATR